MSSLREIFNDKYTRVASVIFLLAAIAVVFNSLSHIEDNHPLIGVFSLALVPVLVVIGGIIFIIAIWRLKE